MTESITFVVLPNGHSLGSNTTIDLTTGSWQAKRTDESREIEAILKDRFERVDAYRYDGASIRVRVIDPRFKRMSVGRRDDLVDVCLSQLPESIQGDIMNLLT